MTKLVSYLALVRNFESPHAMFPPLNIELEILTEHHFHDLCI